MVDRIEELQRMIGKIGKEYLGDGVYAGYDGYHVVLYTDNGRGTNTIYLDHEVMSNLKRYVEHIEKCQAEYNNEFKNE